MRHRKSGRHLSRTSSHRKAMFQNMAVSLFEHEVRILADEGVHPCVPPEEWQSLARLVAREMRDQTPGRALLTAVERAGGLVSARGPRRAADDANELPDAPVERAR